MPSYIKPNRTGDALRKNRFMLLFPDGGSWLERSITSIKIPEINMDIGEMWDGTVKNLYVSAVTLGTCDMSFYAYLPVDPIFKYVRDYVEFQDKQLSVAKIKPNSTKSCSYKKNIIVNLVDGLGTTQASYKLLGCLVKSFSISEFGYARMGDVTEMSMSLAVERIILPGQDPNSFSLGISSSGISGTLSNLGIPGLGSASISIGSGGISASLGSGCNSLEVGLGPNGLEASGSYMGMEGGVSTVDGFSAGTSIGGTNVSAGTGGFNIGR